MKIIYFYHIPKCAGTTISQVLQRIAKSQNGEFHNFNHKMDKKFNFVRREINNFKMIKFIHSMNHKTNELKIIHHHLHYQHTAKFDIYGYPASKEIFIF